MADGAGVAREVSFEKRGRIPYRCIEHEAGAASFPGVQHDEFADNLRDKLLADEVDVIIVPDAFTEARFSILSLGAVQSAWMAKPGLLPASRSLRIHELAAYTILTQGDKSGTGIIFDRWFKSQGIEPANAISSNSLLALIGLTVSGMGVSYLPRLCLQSLIDRGALQVIETKPVLPKITYVALYRGERKSKLISSILMLAQECCNFSELFQVDEPAVGKAGGRPSGIELF